MQVKMFAIELRITQLRVFTKESLVTQTKQFILVHRWRFYDYRCNLYKLQ